MNKKLETICNYFYKSGVLDEEKEEILIDYLYTKGIEIEIDYPKEALCDAVLLQNKINIEEYKEKLFKDIDVEVSGEYKSYGNLDIETFLNIAMLSDDRTLLKLINISKIHREKFNDRFFKKYLEIHYPESIKFKPFNKTFKQYYLELIYAIDILKREYDFDYSSEDVIQIYKDVKRIKSINFNPQKYLETIKMNEFKND